MRVLKIKLTLLEVSLIESNYSCCDSPYGNLVCRSEEDQSAEALAGVAPQEGEESGASMEVLSVKLTLVYEADIEETGRWQSVVPVPSAATSETHSQEAANKSDNLS